MPVGAAVTVDVSILWEKLRYFTTAETPSITLAEGGNSIGVTLRRAFKDGSSFGAIFANAGEGDAEPLSDVPQLSYERTSGSGFGFSFQGEGDFSDGRAFAWYLNGKKLSGAGKEISLAPDERAYIQTAGGGAEGLNSIICVFDSSDGGHYAAEERFTVAAPLAGTLASVNASANSGAALQQGSEVTFSHTDNAATIHLTVSPTDGVTRGSDAISGEITGGAGQSITLAFNNVTTSGNPYTVTAWATRSGYADSQKITFTYTVQGNALNAVTADPQPSDTALIRGQNSSVTFSHADKDATIHLRVTSTAASTSGFEVTSGGTADGGTVTGNGSVTLNFTAAGEYTVTARATKDGHADSTQTIFNYTVVNPTASGQISTNPNPGTLTMTDGKAAVTFSYTDATDATIHLTLSNTTSVQIANGNLNANTGAVTGNAGQAVTLTFSAEGDYNITESYVSIPDHQDSRKQTFTYTVQKPTLAGRVTATPPSGTTLTRGQNATVTFSYTDGNGRSVEDRVIIHLTLSDAAGVTAASGTSGGTPLTIADDKTVTGEAGKDIVLTFAPTTDNKSYAITNAYATLDNYKNSETVASLASYTVRLQKLTGTVTADPTSGIPLTLTGGKAAVTFRYNGGAVSDTQIVVSGLPASGVEVASGSQTINVSSGEATGRPGQDVTVTFTSAGSHANIRAYAKSEGYIQSDTATFSYTVQKPQLGAVTATMSGGATINDNSTLTLTRGNTVTFRYNNSSVSDATIHISGLPQNGGVTVTNGNGSPITVSDGGTATGAAGQTVDVTFTAADATTRTVTAYATRTGSTQSPEFKFRYTVINPQLRGSITATPAAASGNPEPTGNTLTRGDTVTFTYTGGETDANGNKATIRLTLDNTAGVSVSGGTISNNTVTGEAGKNVVLTFEPTTDNATYRITNVYATLANYRQTTASTTPLVYTVRNSTLPGRVTASKSSGTMTRNKDNTVTFTHTGNNGLNTTIHLTVEPATDVQVANGTLNSSSGVVTGTAGQAVTLTFEPTDDNTRYTISNAYASLDGYRPTTAGNNITYTVRLQKLGAVTVTAGGSDISAGSTRTLTRTAGQGASVTFSYAGAGANSAIIRLNVSPTANVTYASGSSVATAVPNGGQVVGAQGQSVTLNFGGTGTQAYTVSNVRATGDGYNDSDASRFTFNVQDPTLSGRVTATRTFNGSTANLNSTETLTRSTYVTFSYNGADASDAQIVVSGLPTNWTDSYGTITSGDRSLTPSGGTVTGNAGQTVVVTFNSGSVSPNAYNITAHATRSGYTKSADSTYNLTIQNPQLGGSVSPNKNSGATMTRGQDATVTFSYSGTETGANTNAAIHLTVQPAVGVSVINGTLNSSSGVVTGTGGPVTLTFAPTASGTTYSTTYRVSSVYASLDGYRATTATATTFSYTVGLPQLTGSFSASERTGSTIVAGGRVMFTYTDINVTDAQIVLSGLPANGKGVTVRNGSRFTGEEITVSANGEARGGKGQHSVTVTFTSAGNYTVIPRAEKTEALDQHLFAKNSVILCNIRN